MHDKIDLVYAMNEEMAYGAATAIKEAGRQNEMVIVSANGSAVGKEMLQAGTLLATTGWSPSENGILATIKALECLNGTPEKYLTESPLGLYTKDNLDKYPDWEAAGQAKVYEPILRQKGYWN
jgi:ABC-type sugar transport system substrate-binding protein